MGTGRPRQPALSALPAHGCAEQKRRIEFGAIGSAAHTKIKIKFVRGRVDRTDHRKASVATGQERVVFGLVGPNAGLAHQPELVVQGVGNSR